MEGAVIAFFSHSLDAERAAAMVENAWITLVLEKLLRVDNRPTKEATAPAAVTGAAPAGTATGTGAAPAPHPTHSPCPPSPSSAHSGVEGSGWRRGRRERRREGGAAGATGAAATARQRDMCCTSDRTEPVEEVGDARS